MIESFRYRCRRRPNRVVPELAANDLALRGAGSGGGGGPGGYFGKVADGDRTDFVNGTYSVGGADCGVYAFGWSGSKRPELQFFSGECEVFSRAGSKGLINAHATQGIRFTVGPPMQPDAKNTNIQGYEVQVGDNQYVSLMRGMDPDSTNQKIIMEDTGILIKGGDGSVDITSHQEILISAGGIASISVTPKGIVMKGPIIRIN